MSERTQILMLDDEPNILSAFRRSLGRRFDIVAHTSGHEALEALRGGLAPPVIVTDMRMPEMSGLEFVVEARTVRPDSVYVMLTGNSDQQTAIDAINKGEVFRFLNKPCPPEMLEHILKGAIRQHQLIHAEKALLRDTLAGSVKLLVEAVTMSDTVIDEATRRVRADVKAITDQMGVPRWEFQIAASLAFLGSAAVPATEKDELSEEYLEAVAETGGKLVRNIPRLEVISGIIGGQRSTGDAPWLPDDPGEEELIGFGARLLRFCVDWHRATKRTSNDSRKAGLQKLELAKPLYDDRFFGIAWSMIREKEGKGAGAPIPQVMRVRIDKIRAGDFVQEDIKTTEGILLVNRRKKVTDLLLEKVRRFTDAGFLNPELIVEIYREEDEMEEAMAA